MAREERRTEERRGEAARGPCYCCRAARLSRATLRSPLQGTLGSPHSLPFSQSHSPLGTGHGLLAGTFAAKGSVKAAAAPPGVPCQRWPAGNGPAFHFLGGWTRDREGDGLPQARAPLKVFPQIWQKWGRPSWWRLATCLSRGPFSVKRCSQNSQLKGLSPVWVRLCLSRLAVGTGRGLSRGASATGQGGDGQPHLGCGRSCHRGGTGRASRPCACAGAC